MPSRQPVRMHTAKLLQLLAQELDGLPGVQFGIVDASAFELSVLVMLDQGVIGVAREGQWIESERVDRWLLQ